MRRKAASELRILPSRGRSSAACNEDPLLHPRRRLGTVGQHLQFRAQVELHR